jgi:hypothetical protein
MNQFITLTEAANMTALYRQNRESILQSSYREQAVLPLSETFDRAPFDTLLARPSCTGLRIYYGMDQDLKVHALIVGVDEDGRDLLPSTASSLTATGDDDYIIEHGNRCPDICPAESPLNS